MGITGLLPFIEKASRRTNISEFSGCTVAIDSYCWLHKGAFACADKLVRGEDTDIHIRYCLKYVNMLLSKNVKPILVFDGRHLPAKAMTESKRRESRNISKKRAAELLSLGKMEEARSYMRRSVDITHEMALSLIRECRKRNVDCIVAPYEADSQLAYLNINNYAHLVITEDSDLILFGCTKVLFKMDLEGMGTLVETVKLPLVMKCPIEQYSFDKFRQMCVMSGCDYLASLPGIGLAKARQFVTATQDSNFANALKKLPSFFNRSNLTVSDEYRENFLKAEATFKHQYVYDPLERRMLRLTEPDNEDIEQALCVNAGELLDPKVAFQLALGNLDPFTLKKMDDWHPDHRPTQNVNIKTSNWKEQGVSNYASIWSSEFKPYLDEPCPWQKKPRVEVSAFTRRPPRRVINLVSKVVPETQDQDESLSIESLSNMYCIEPSTKRLKTEEIPKQRLPDEDLNEVKKEKEKSPSPILVNKERSFRKGLRNGYNILQRLSKFPRTVLGDNVVESKFFSASNSTKTTSDTKNNGIILDESPEKNRNPFKISEADITNTEILNSNIKPEITEADVSIMIEESPLKSRNPFKKSVDNTSTENISNLSKNSIFIQDSPNKNCCKNAMDSDETICTDLDSSQKENSPYNSPMKTSPILEPSPGRNLLKSVVKKLDESRSEDTVIENTYPMEMLVTPIDSQESFGASQPKPVFWSSQSRLPSSQPIRSNIKSSCRVPGLKRTASLPANQPTLLSKFGFQKKPALKR